MIKIEFPADRRDIAAAMGRALLEVGGVELNHSVRERVGDLEVETVTTTQPVAATTGWHDENGPIVVGTEGGGERPPLIGDEPDNDTRHIDGEEPVSLGGTADTTIGVRAGSAFDTAAPATDALPQVDHNGVAFSAAMCGVSADPFYATGKNKGQWKKRRGVDQTVYYDWYAAQAQPEQAPLDDAPVNTGAAFGADTAAAAAPAVPTTVGEFMGWVSEKQVAELMTQDDVTDAYFDCGLQITDLFPPFQEATVAARVASLHARLVVKAGA